MKFSALSEAEQFKILHEQYEAVRRYLTASGVSGVEQDEILQDTMVTVWRKIHTLRDDDKLEAWVRAIARNNIRKFYRRRARQREQVWLYGDLELGLSERYDRGLAGDAAGMEPEGAKKEKLKESLVYRDLQGFEDSELYELVLQLGEPASIILSLHYGYRETYEEIAETLRMNPSTVRSIAMRSREKLKVMIEREEGCRYAYGRRIQENDQ